MLFSLRSPFISLWAPICLAGTLLCQCAADDFRWLLLHLWDGTFQIAVLLSQTISAWVLNDPQKTFNRWVKGEGIQILPRLYLRWDISEVYSSFLRLAHGMKFQLPIIYGWLNNTHFIGFLAFFILCPHFLTNIGKWLAFKFSSPPLGKPTWD